MVKYKHKKQQNDGLMSGMMPSFAMAGGSMGMAVVGGKMQKHLPAGMPNPMVSGAKAMGDFVPITATVGSATVVSKQLKKLIKEMKGIK